MATGLSRGVTLAVAGAGLSVAAALLVRHLRREQVVKHLSVVQEKYAATALGTQQCCVAKDASGLSAMGYSPEERELGQRLGADLGVGCGNPVALARLVEGEVVLDLGSGGGFDCILSAKAVGATGKVIGVDMTEEMLALAGKASERAGVQHITEFRKGQIEALPVEDRVADVVISNCVINLSPDKRRVCREMFRALKPGGRVAISDVIQLAALPESLRTEEALACWVSGAPSEDDLAADLAAAGFEAVCIEQKPQSAETIKGWLPGSGAEKYVVSANVTATKPTAAL